MTGPLSVSLKVTGGPSCRSQWGSVREQHNGLERGHFRVSLLSGRWRGMGDARRLFRLADRPLVQAEWETGSVGVWRGLGATPEPVPRLACLARFPLPGGTVWGSQGGGAGSGGG